MNDLVTACEEVRGGFRITLNHGDVFRLNAADYRALPLQAGDVIDADAYRQTLLTRQMPLALHRAVGLLAARARSRSEVERRLTEAGYLPEAVEAAVRRLTKENLLDDAAFARAFASAGSSRGLGRARILRDLRAKGIPEALAEAALAALDADAQQAEAVRAARKILRRYLKLPPREAKQKAIAAMLRRGYAYGEAARALAAAQETPEPDGSDS